VLSVLPLDDFVDSPATRMEVVGDAVAIPEICREFATLVGQAAGRAVKLATIERFAFYQRARDAFAIIATGETRLYGNLLLRKGIIRPA
jgi:L-fucose mutarotase